MEPLCWVSTHVSHAAERNMGKARNCLKCSIHAPGFGSIFSSFGEKERMR